MIISSDNPVVIITGTSRGLGKAFVKAVSAIFPYAEIHSIVRTLPDQVYGNIKNFKADLRDPLSGRAVVAEIFSTLKVKSMRDFILINNAGILGPIRPLIKVDEQDFIDVINVNFISLAFITREFLKQTSGTDFNKRLVINISSGAAQHPYAGWTAYCSSKAALDMLTSSLALELTDNKTVFTSVSPGVLDTEMQGTIRSSDIADFPLKNRFVELYQNNELTNPDRAAEIIIHRCRTKGYKNGEIIDIRTIV